MRRLYDFPHDIITTAYEPEDWQGLERYIAASGLNEREALLEIVRSQLEPDAKEWRLKSRHPEAYEILLREVYPSLRHSDYAVRYEIREFKEVEEIMRMMKTAPQKLSLQELYLAAQQMETGSEGYVETFEIAVRMYPDDETANLNAANTAMSHRNLKKAGNYLAKAGNSPETVYARGVHAALSGEYARAATFFEEALRKGVEKAGEALSQLRELAEKEK